MPTKKQRRRRQKSLRHEYEYVWVDDEGNEVEVDADEVAAKTNGKRPAAQRKGESRARTQPRGRSARAVEPPSWRRVWRRALFIGPLLVVAMMVLNRNLPVAERIAPAVLMLAFFLPFSYAMDSFAYRLYRKRVERGGGAKR